MGINPDIVFRQHFPSLSAQFELKDFQRRVIQRVVSKRSILAIMPTGGGKSLIYWVAGKALGGITFVISPLIALIDEQAEKLREQGCSALVFHGGQPATEQIRALTMLFQRQLTPDFIFASPERLATDGYFSFCLRARANDIKLLVVDEIHCVSQWGYDFRPFYKRIPDFFLEVFAKTTKPPLLGLTATINPKELEEITEDFDISRTYILKDDVLLRFGIRIHVELFEKEDEKEARLWELLEQHQHEKVLIYLYRKFNKRGVEDLCERAKAEKNLSAIAFHGDMNAHERQQVLEQVRKNAANVIFATNAFGMGIDIPDIRVVIHFMIPESIEQYYQEIGRAGRDQKEATAYLLYTGKNFQVRRTHFIDKSFPPTDEIKRIFKKIANNETGLKTLPYFTDEEIQNVFPYFLQAGSIRLVAKGFGSFGCIGATQNTNVVRFKNASQRGVAIAVLQKLQSEYPEVQTVFDTVYQSIAEGKTVLAKPLDKCFIIESTEAHISDAFLQSINNEMDRRRQYKYDLLDYLAYLLQNFEDSTKFHQEIGRYLGVSKHQLGKIYQTKNGEWVRSKSEVIIANLLSQHGLSYTYEKRLDYALGKWILPDFTILHHGKVWHWEHLGLLGKSDYDEDWRQKKEIYKQLKIDNLITTQESALLSSQVLEKINAILP